MSPGFLRTLSQRLAGNRTAKDRLGAVPGTGAPPAGGALVCPDPAPPASGPRKLGVRQHCQCRVQLLDLTCVDFVLPKNAPGHELYERVFAHLDLEERDYFGVQFTDHFQVHHWLDPTKKIRKQVPIGPPFTFRFRVKFFSSEPANLREELTRYQFFLQLRQDIQSGKLECPRGAAVELAALALESEFGDFNPKEHTLAWVSEFHFHPAQDEQMERDILHQFGTRCTGLSPSQAELAYLNRARMLDFYGVDMHPVEGRDGNTYRLGLTPVGMQVFDGRQKIGLFLWEKIQRLDFRGRKLTLMVEEDLEQPKCAGQLVQLHTFVFELSSHKACKHLWKCAIEYHTFYRLKFHQTRVHRPNRIQLFRLGSTFRYRGRTEYESVHREELLKGVEAARPRRNEQFARKPSQRYAPRQRREEEGIKDGAQRQEGRQGPGDEGEMTRRGAPGPPPDTKPKSTEIGQKRPIRSAIPIPSAQRSVDANNDEAPQPPPSSAASFVTTIRIHRENAEREQRARMGGGDGSTGGTRIPSLISPSSLYTNPPKFVSTSKILAHDSPRKDTKIPVVHSSGTVQRTENGLIKGTDRRGKATEFF